MGQECEHAVLLRLTVVWVHAHGKAHRERVVHRVSQNRLGLLESAEEVTDLSLVSLEEILVESTLGGHSNLHSNASF